MQSHATYWLDMSAMDLCDDLHGLIFRLLDVSSMYSWLFISTQALVRLQTYWDHGGHHPSKSDMTVSLDAVQRGYIHLLEWHMTRSNLVTMTGSHLIQAARRGQLAMVEWLHQSQGCTWNDTVCMMAADSGHFKLLQYLHDHGCPWSINALLCAAFNGHFEIVKYLSECGCPFDAVVYSAAAQGGSVEILQYLRSVHPGCHWDPQSCAHNAVARGHLAMLQYLHTEGCDWRSWDCCYAARYGHLLKYLREHGCPWDAVSPANAAGQGHLEVIEYLQEQGCPWDARARVNATKNGHLKVLEYLDQHEL